MDNEEVSDASNVSSPLPQDTPKCGLLWSVTSGLYNAGAGAVGAGVGGMKWAASTTYSLGSGIVNIGCSTVKKVASSKAKTKSD